MPLNKRLYIVAVVIPVPEFMRPLDANTSNSSSFPTLAINFNYKLAETKDPPPVSQTPWSRTGYGTLIFTRSGAKEDRN